MWTKWPHSSLVRCLLFFLAKYPLLLLSSSSSSSSASIDDDLDLDFVLLLSVNDLGEDEDEDVIDKDNVNEDNVDVVDIVGTRNWWYNEKLDVDVDDKEETKVLDFLIGRRILLVQQEDRFIIVFRLDEQDIGVHHNTWHDWLVRFVNKRVL